MQFLRDHCVKLLGGLAIVAVALSGVQAKDEVKQPNPKKTLMSVAKKLAKTRSYSSTCSVKGGVADLKSDELKQVVVNEDYAANLYGPVMHVPKLNVFRKGQQKGAIRNGSQWQHILATAEGARLDRLFGYPTDLMVTAMKGADKVYWLERDEDEVTETEEEDEEEVGRGSTGVVKKSTNKNKILPTVLRVELTPKSSVQRFTVVENSGCMSGG